MTFFRNHSRQFITLIVITAVIFVGLWQKPRIQAALTYSYCDTPVTYSIGQVDTGFNLTSAQFTVDAADAAKIWNEAAGQPLFVRDPQGTLSVNLIYDKRQGLHNQVSGLEQDLDKNQSTLDKEVADYDRLAADFKKRLDAFNAEVSNWNQQGGAPPSEYDRLTAEQKSLKDENARLNQIARRLNRETDTFNSQVATLNNTIDTLATTLKQRPEEGLYIPASNRIEIYFNITHNELVHTLAHELGHSLGLGHVEKNPQAIMYPLTSNSLQLSLEDRAALADYCQDRNWLVDYATRTWNTLTRLKLLPAKAAQ